MNYDIEVDLLTETAASPSSTSVQPTTDFEILEKSIGSVSAMLDRVLTYVRAVIAGEVKGDAAVGKYLMDMLGASTEDLEKGGFNASLQVRTTVLRKLCFIDSFISGYIDVLLLGKSRAITSRSLFEACIDYVVVHLSSCYPPTVAHQH